MKLMHFIKSFLNSKVNKIAITIISTAAAKSLQSYPTLCDPIDPNDCYILFRHDVVKFIP